MWILILTFGPVSSGDLRELASGSLVSREPKTERFEHWELSKIHPIRQSPGQNGCEAPPERHFCDLEHQPEKGIKRDIEGNRKYLWFCEALLQNKVGREWKDYRSLRF
jgi:hypothetical protein